MSASALRQADSRQTAERPVRLAAAPSTPEPGHDAPLSQSASTVESKPSPLVLHVLSGLQKGAQARMRHQRLLVGNLHAECDVVLEIGSPLPHTCLVRASRDGWTVLPITGDLWHGSSLLTSNEAHPIASGDVLTLGDVAFCIADPRKTDLSQVKAPATLPARASAARQVPAPATSLSKAGSTGNSSSGGGAFPWRGVTLLLLAAAAASVAAYVASAPSTSATAPTTRGDALEAARAALSTRPWAAELRAQADPIHPRRIVLTGYLPQREQLQALEADWRARGLEVEHRWVAVNELSVDLAQRLSLPADQLRYEGRGSFAADTTSHQVPALDRAIRRVLQDSPAVNGLRLRLTDKPPVDRAGMPSPVTVNFQRAPEQPGGIAVTGLEFLQPPPKLQRYVVRELRLGRLPSVVLDNGARYFEGSVLPGGATLTQVTAQQIRVQAGAETLSLPMEAGVQVAGQAPARSAGPGR